MVRVTAGDGGQSRGAPGPALPDLDGLALLSSSTPDSHRSWGLKQAFLAEVGLRTPDRGPSHLTERAAQRGQGPWESHTAKEGTEAREERHPPSPVMFNSSMFASQESPSVYPGGLLQAQKSPRGRAHLTLLTSLVNPDCLI